MAHGHRRRVMKKVFENGIESLLEHEFLELCLFSVYKRRDTNPLAHALLDKFGSLEAVCNATVEELTKVEGIGLTAAEYIKLIPLIAKGYVMHTSARKKNIYSTRESMCQRCVALLNGHINEIFYILCFDNMNHLIKEVKLAEGTPGMVSVEPRRITDAIANSSTTKVMLCHNHPSGVRIPSNQDISMTAAIEDLLNTVGVELIEHIIVVGNEYVSCVAI